MDLGMWTNLYQVWDDIGSSSLIKFVLAFSWLVLFHSDQKQVKSKMEAKFCTFIANWTLNMTVTMVTVFPTGEYGMT